MPTLQLGRDSRMKLDWLQTAYDTNPPGKIMDPKTGQFTGNYTTGPVRLAWTKSLITANKNDNGEEVFGVTPMFPLGADLSVLVQAVNEIAALHFPENLGPQGFHWGGLLSPWHDQIEKANQYKGYTPGAWYFNCTTRYKPRIVDPNMNDIVDERRVYPGVWAILAVNPYKYPTGSGRGRGPTKRGVSFGLQSTVLIAEDEVLGGGGTDPRQAFAGLNIQAGVNISASFGVQPPVAPNAGTGPANLDQMRALGLL